MFDNSWWLITTLQEKTGKREAWDRERKKKKKEKKEEEGGGGAEETNETKQKEKQGHSKTKKLRKYTCGNIAAAFNEKWSFASHDHMSL